jgi:hypothetical protein
MTENPNDDLPIEFDDQLLKAIEVMKEKLQ